MNHTIQLTAEQFEAFQSGKPITIEPPKSAITKWEPAGGEYTIKTALDSVVKCKSAKPFRLVGLEYQTETQANSAAKQLRAYARQLAWLAENDDGWVVDWDDYDQNKYFIQYSNEHSEFQTSNVYQANHISTIFMSHQNATKLAQLMNDGIVEF